MNGATAILLVLPALLQAGIMLVDELHFHRRRGLPRWERLGHPLDTLTTALCYAWLLAMPRAPWALAVYVGLAVQSSIFITKDEPVHARVCSPGEHWVHALLFVLHPIVLGSWAALWWTRSPLATVGLPVQLIATFAWMTYQLVYWSFLWKPRT